MYFNKIPHPANFTFAQSAEVASGAAGLVIGTERVMVRWSDCGDDVHRLVLEHARFGDHGSQAILTPPENPNESRCVITAETDGRLILKDRSTGETFVAGLPGATFGWCGAAWILQFAHRPEMQFFGLGEHSQHLEKSGQRIKYWNTDLFGDFPKCEAEHGYANPMYVAIPWLIVKQENRYVGLLVNNPGAVFMDLASNFVWSENNQEDRQRGSFYLGAPSGQPDVHLIVGPSLPELIRKFQSLVGRMPVPPLWALGHHQCRWGYAGARDLRRLDNAFRKHRIPCDGLWLDIDYMDSYKVFTFSRQAWGGDETKVREVLAELLRRGRRVAVILDPGVKAQRGYSVCEDGQEAEIFCLNSEGKPFVGFVWPGKTYFPDFSLPETRAWWAERVRALAECGISGAWIDMNDPSVGAVEPQEMLFARGKKPHAYYHNQYALGMAQATYDGFMQARPDERPFVISRSASTSSARFTAVWLGDNVSNWHHLRMSIPLALGLGLSGIPFNGADVCGFKEDTTPELAIAWYKAGFLFPFFRNHSDSGTRSQEPYALGPRALEVARHYIQLRYKLLPYLYQLFLASAATGEAILRPLFYQYPDDRRGSLGKLENIFLVGPDILQAPIVEEKEHVSVVALPVGEAWYDARVGKWVKGGTRVRAKCASSETPLFIREGAVIPMQEGVRTTNENQLEHVELHCFLRRRTSGRHRLVYQCDDGLTLGYQRGERTTLELEAQVVRGKLTLTVKSYGCDYRPLSVRVVVYDEFENVEWTQNETSQRLAIKPLLWTFTGKKLRALATTWFEVKHLGGTTDVHR